MAKNDPDINGYYQQSPYFRGTQEYGQLIDDRGSARHPTDSGAGVGG